MGGAMSRNKGARFERQLRAHWPDAMVRRSSQAHSAHQSDVYIAGGPPLLARLWIEAQDARQPTPLAKLEQAEGDIDGLALPERGRLPIVVWHRLGERTIQVTTRLWVLDAVRSALRRVDDSMVTMSLPDFLALLGHAVESGEQVAA